MQAHTESWSSNRFDIKRGDIFYVMPGYNTGSEQRAGRPAVIVSNDDNNKHSSTVEVVYCTTRIKPELPTHTIITSTPYESTILGEQITTVATERLGSYIGRCADEEMKEIERCMAESLKLQTVDDNGKDEKICELQVELDMYKKMYQMAVERAANTAIWQSRAQAGA